MFSGGDHSFRHYVVADDEDAPNPSPNHDQVKSGIQVMQLGAFLGLQLRITPSLIDMIQKSIAGENQLTNFMPIMSSNDDESHDSSKDKQIQYDDKVKASNVNALLLKIGTWQRVSKHEGDLVGKCYFAKRKMVWEILENALKIKIEIDWCDIIAMRAITKENEPGVLEIELNKPPKFYMEHDLQPRKHSKWQTVTDFTDGQAETYRRHYLLFAPKALDKYYEKLIHYDKRFFQMSQKCFPSLRSPYFQRSFQKIDFSFPQPFGQNFPYISQNFNIQQQALQPYFRTHESLLPSSVLGSNLGQIYDYHIAKRQRTTDRAQNNILEKDHYYPINGGHYDLVQNQVRRLFLSSSLHNLRLPSVAYNEVSQQQTPSIPQRLEPNLNPLVCFPKPGNFSKPVSFSYKSHSIVPRFVEATAESKEINAFTGQGIDTVGTDHEQADDSCFPNYYSCFYDYDDPDMEGLYSTDRS